MWKLNEQPPPHTNCYKEQKQAYYFVLINSPKRDARKGNKTFMKIKMFFSEDQGILKETAISNVGFFLNGEIGIKHCKT